MNIYIYIYKQASHKIVLNFITWVNCNIPSFFLLHWFVKATCELLNEVFDGAVLHWKHKSD